MPTCSNAHMFSFGVIKWHNHFIIPPIAAAPIHDHGPHGIAEAWRSVAEGGRNMGKECLLKAFSGGFLYASDGNTLACILPPFSFHFKLALHSVLQEVCSLLALSQPFCRQMVRICFQGCTPGSPPGFVSSHCGYKAKMEEEGVFACRKGCHSYKEEQSLPFPR